MATWTNNNSTHYINPAYLTFVENSGYGPNFIQVSASSSCYISVYDPTNGIGYSDADKNYKRWKVTAYNNKFPDNGAWYIYVRLERGGTSALVIYDRVLRGVSGGEITVGKDEQGNDVYTEAETAQTTYWYIRIGEVSATDGTSIREITYDTGYLVSDQGKTDSSGLNDMWELDKYSTPWLIKAKQWLSGFTVKGIMTLIGSLVLKKGTTEKPITDIKRSTDGEYYLDVDGNPQVDEEGNSVLNPDYAPVSDSTIPSTQYVDNNYLNKTKDDRSKGKISSDKAIEVGNFVTGMIGGSGAKMYLDDNKKSVLEIDKIHGREELIVPKITFNCIDVVTGEMAQTFAYGTIKEVDTTRQVATLDLLDDEYGTLHVNDICRGTFHFLEGGNSEEYSEDANGFHNYSGFSTSYFTPSAIESNGKGDFVFKYELQPGTSVHPCAGMNFYAYGNFDPLETSRKSITYQTRDYTRRLCDMDTWVIDPDKNIKYQDGLLDGLEIGGMEMKGYGTFGNNFYLTGSVFEFTEQQKIELKGESSYSVSLSEYVGNVRMNSRGEIEGGVYKPVNVISGDENVISGDENVVVSDYLLQTAIQAFRGSTQLSYSETVKQGTYIASITTVGCTAVLENGIISITGITDTSLSYIDVAVNCEGNATFNLSYQVKVQKDGTPVIQVDIDNENDSVACDEDGNVLFGLPVGCNISAWAGTEQLCIDRITMDVPDGVTASVKMVDQDGNEVETSSESTEYTCGVLSVTAIGKDAAKVLPVNLSVYVTYGGKSYQRDLVFTVNKIMAGENAVIYKLKPSTSAVKVDCANELSVSLLNCKVIGYNGKKASELTELPDGLSMQVAVDSSKEEDYVSYAYGEDITLTADNEYVTFRLYRDGIMEDSETVLVLKDGDSPVTLDLDNEMQSVACDEDGNVLFGLPLSTTARMYFGNEQMEIVGGAVTLYSVPDGVTASVKDNTVTVTAIGSGSSDTLKIGISATGIYGGITYPKLAYLTVNKIRRGENAVLYDLLPSSSVIKVDDEGVYSPTHISCGVKETTGKSKVESIGALPEGYTMKCSANGGEAKDYTLNDSLAVDGWTEPLTFYLYYGDTLWDKEVIPVVKDGVPTFKSTVFRRTNTTPDTPAGGSFSSPIPEDKDSNGNRLWSDGVPAGEEILWASTRVFTSDGNPPQQDGWTTPQQMTDTASFEAIYSESVTEPDTPVGTPEDANFYEVNTQWTDDPTVNSVWMATSVKKNGSWQPWVVTKIKGEAGTDALTLQASTRTVSRNSFGSYQPANLRIRALRNGVEEPAYITVYGVKEDGSVGTVAACAYVPYVDINLATLYSADYKRLVARAYETATTDYSATDYIAEETVVFIGDGGSGQMPRNCGEYDSSTVYYYNNEYRDFIWKTTSSGTKVYIRDGFGAAYPKNSSSGGISGVDPESDETYWKEAPKTTLTAIDTALIDEANIAGFMFKNGKMVSQENDPRNEVANLILDGGTGYFKCVNADVDGNITVGSLAYKVLYASGGTYTLGEVGMVIGWGTFNLPSVGDLLTMEIRFFFENWSRTARVCKLVSTDGTPIRITAKSGYAQNVSEYIFPDDNVMYSVVLAYNSLSAEAYWMVNASIGGSESGGISLLVDSEMDSESEYPVQNKVIYKKFESLGPFTYDSDKGYWKFNGDMLVTGGVTMFGNDSAFETSTVMDAVWVDGTTVSKANGYLEVIGGTGGGASTWDDISGKPSWIGGTKPTYKFSEILNPPTTLSGYGITDASISDGTVTLGGSSITPITGVTTSGNYIRFTRGGGNVDVTAPYAVAATHLTSYRAVTFTKTDNSGMPCYLLIADLTSWYNKTTNADYGLVGVMYGKRGGIQSGTCVQKMIAWCSEYTATTGNGNARKLQTDIDDFVEPRIVKYNSTYWLALYMKGSGRSHYFIGQASNLLSSPTELMCDSNGEYSGLTVVYYATKMTLTGLAFGEVLYGSNYAKSFSAAGWYRFAASVNTANYGGNYMFAIRRVYNNTYDESYQVAVSIDNSGNAVWSQLSGVYKTQLITQVRCTYESGGTIYFDLYYKGTASNQICVNSIGEAKLQTLAVTTLTYTNTSTFILRNYMATSSNLLVGGGITMFSDIRKKTSLGDVELTLAEIAEAPLIKHYYNSDGNKTVHVGSIAQYWAGLNDWFCKKDEEGFYTMEVQNCALASAISLAREFTRYKSETEERIRALERKIEELTNNKAR